MQDQSYNQSEQVQPVIEHGRAYNEMMKLFQEKSFMEKMKATFSGLNCPKDSGEYKFAKLQIQLMAGPLLAVIMPIIAVIILLNLKTSVDDKKILAAVEVLEPELPPEIEEPPEPPIPETVDFAKLDTEFDNPTANFNPEISVVQDQPLSPKPAEMNSVALNKSPVTMKNIIGSRTPGQRGALLSQGGGMPGGEATVLRALRWLKFKQESDGSWPGNKISNTGLALLCYLAHGDTPSGDCPEFGDTVNKGIQYLVSRQGADGYFGGNGYAHSIATYALAEAYTMTSNPVLKPALENAVKHIIDKQHASGGWNYFTENNPARDDTSVMGWAAQAIKAATLAKDTVGLDAPGLDKAYKNAVNGFKKNSHPNGGFGYDHVGRGGLSGVGVLCMQLLGAAKEPEVERTLKFLDDCKFSFANWDQNQPWRGQNSPIYYWYYITQAKFQTGGQRWKNWNNEFAPEMIKNQQILAAVGDDPDRKQFKQFNGMVVENKNLYYYKDQHGEWRDIGYWDSPSNDEHDGNKGGVTYEANSVGAPNRWENGVKIAAPKATSDGERVQMTALCALQMMVYYRYLPTTQVRPEEKEPEVKTDVGEIVVGIRF